MTNWQEKKDKQRLPRSSNTAKDGQVDSGGIAGKPWRSQSFDAQALSKRN